MNDKLPKPMLDALAGEPAPVEHPSPGVLAAFVERTLGEGENRSVTNHLAHCGECREVVFLASGVAEEAMHEQPAAGSVAKPRSKWMPKLAWALPVVAVAALVGGYFVWHRETTTVVGPELASKTAPEAPIKTPDQQREIAPAQPPQQGSSPIPVGTASRPATKRPDAKPATTPSAQKVASEKSDAVAMNAAPPPPRESVDLRAKPESPKPAQRAPVNAINGALGGIAPSPRANGFAPSAAENETLRQFGATDSLSLSVNRAATSAARPVHPGWRITPQGQLEHLTPDGWASVLLEQGAVFRAVSVIGSQVCAGGEGGALFQSSDSGAHWNKASLVSDGQSETAAIVSIRFDDSEHGVVVTAAGSSYRTSDGGATWTKQ